MFIADLGREINRRGAARRFSLGSIHIQTVPVGALGVPSFIEANCFERSGSIARCQQYGVCIEPLPRACNQPRQFFLLSVQHFDGPGDDLRRRAWRDRGANVGRFGI